MNKLISRTDRIMLRTENDKCRNIWNKVSDMNLRCVQYLLGLQNSPSPPALLLHLGAPYPGEVAMTILFL